MIKTQLQAIVGSLCDEPGFAFLSQGNGAVPLVKVGQNCLDTCYIFDVVGSHGRRLMTVKIYDKVADLVTRDGC